MENRKIQGITCMIMLICSSEIIFNPVRYTGICYYQYKVTRLGFPIDSQLLFPIEPHPLRCRTRNMYCDITPQGGQPTVTWFYKEAHVPNQRTSFFDSVSYACLHVHLYRCAEGKVKKRRGGEGKSCQIT